jgi:hypothetical protein
MTEARRPLDHVETCGKWHNRRASEVAKQKKIVAHVLLPSLPPTPILQHPLRDAVVPFYFNANAVRVHSLAHSKSPAGEAQHVGSGPGSALGLGRRARTAVVWENQPLQLRKPHGGFYKSQKAAVASSY